MKTNFTFIFFLSLSISLFAQEVDIELFQEGFTRPLDLQNAGDSRLFIVEQGGKIKIVQEDGTVNSTLFLDISNKVSSGNERGLLGLSFHPNYSSNGYFFINYTNTDGDTQVSRFTVDSENPDLANPDSELEIIGYDQPQANHNGGAMAFGPDGFLYIASGDGGGSGDVNNNAQNLNLLLGKLLRIDVDTFSGGNNYGIPPDNPFVSVQNTRSEIWAFGLRNPWRFSFDEVENNLWIADVGQQQIEEINRQPIGEGGVNYGWRCYEGNAPFNTNGCPDPSEITFPFAEYTHTAGNCSITGGYVYRGTTYSDIQGLYFFADYCSGMIGTVDDDGTLINHGVFPGMWVSFGEDVNKELFAVDINGGKIYKIKGGEVIGTDSFSFDTDLQMFPNPASEHVSLITKQAIINKVQILDLGGRLVHDEVDVASDEKQIPISHLEAGIYLVQVFSAEGQTLTKKLIID